MGRGALIRLKFVQWWTDKTTGNEYAFFRRKGSERIPLPLPVGGEEFMRAYNAALAGAPLKIGARLTRAGSFSAVCVSYYGSAQFTSLANNTQRNRRRILEKFRAEKGEDGIENGFRAIVELRRADVQRMVDARSSPRPTKGKDFLKAFRGLMAHALRLQLIARDPCEGVKGPKLKSKGYHSWTEDEIAKFEARWPVGTKPRLGMALLLYTCQRRGDCAAMGRQHVSRGRIRVKQQKTGTELVIPMHSELTRVIEATPNNHLTYLVTEYGKPYSEAGFGNAMREWCDEAGLPHCAAHGLRKAACRRLAEAGCSASEIGAVSGHRSLKELEEYVRAANQARMAANAMAKIQPGRN